MNHRVGVTSAASSLKGLVGACLPTAVEAALQRHGRHVHVRMPAQ